MEKNIELARFIDTLEERRMDDGVSHLYNEKDGGFYFTDEKGSGSIIVTSADEPDLESINKIEAFLTGTEIRLSRTRKKELKAEYHLKRNRYGFYTTSDTLAFEILCAKYDRARYYSSWSDLYFAMADDRREWEIPWKAAIQ